MEIPDSKYFRRTIRTYIKNEYGKSGEVIAVSFYITKIGFPDTPL